MFSELTYNLSKAEKIMTKSHRTFFQSFQVELISLLEVLIELLELAHFKKFIQV